METVKNRSAILKLALALTCVILVVELVGKRRHDGREPSAVSALRDRRLPVDVELWRRAGAIGEIRKRWRLVETDAGLRRALAVGAMAARAAGLVDGFAARQQPRGGLDGLAGQSRGSD